MGNARLVTWSKPLQARSGNPGARPPLRTPASSPCRRSSSSKLPLLIQTRSADGFKLTKKRRIRSPCVAPYAPASTWISSLLACAERPRPRSSRSEEHTSELQSRLHLVCRLLLEKKKKIRLLTARDPDI